MNVIFLQSELLVGIQVISCNLEACIILIFISVPLSDKNAPYMDKTQGMYTFNNCSTLTNTSCIEYEFSDPQGCLETSKVFTVIPSW